MKGGCNGRGVEKPAYINIMKENDAIVIQIQNMPNISTTGSIPHRVEFSRSMHISTTEVTPPDTTTVAMINNMRIM